MLLFNDALENDTSDWDVTIVRALGILLLASLQCRSGDIAEVWLDDQPLPYLTYGDVYLKFVDGGTDPENLEARIILRNEKGFK